MLCLFLLLETSQFMSNFTTKFIIPIQNNSFDFFPILRTNDLSEDDTLLMQVNQLKI